LISIPFLFLYRKYPIVYMAKKLFAVTKGKTSIALKEALKQLTLGIGIGVTVDAVVEVARVPVLNDTGTFGNSDISNFELIFYGMSIAGISAAIIDIGVGRGILTFSKSMIFYLTGLVIGVYFYENTLATMFRIRKFDPYKMVGKYIPPVLPSGTKLPFISEGATPVPPGAADLPAPATPAEAPMAQLAMMRARRARAVRPRFA
jgi:hypothetical protein